MQVWLNDIVQTILEQKPVNVLEIGTGTGLIFYKLAGKIKKYIGTDFSRASIERVGQRVAKGLREYGDTEFHVCAAHELVLNDSQEVDTIVLNSVAQYFPGEQYMDDVIAKSITLLKGKGRIVIGDLRDLRLLESFKLRLELQKLQHAVPVKELTWLAEQEVLKEEELCFSPEYFYRLPAIYPQISFVEIKLKQGDYLNELSKYRYNVVLHLGEKAAMLEPKWHQWQDVTKTDTIFGQLQNAEPVIAFKDAPNPRLNAEKQLNDAINNKIAATVGELVNEIAREDAGIAEMKQIISLAENKGYHLTLLPNEDPFKVNVFLERKPSGKFVKYVHSEQAFNGNTAVTNIPLFTEIASLLQKDLRQHLQNSLPEYMVPGEFIAIAKLPLTNNGKIDRRFLIEREDNTILNKNSYEAPRNDIERALVNIWEQLLIKDKIGIHDNFFELGGHSLLATRTVSAVRKKLALDLFIKDLFVHPTIAQLATHLGSLSNGLLLPPIEVQQRPQQIPLSFSQERLWFIDRLEGTIQYHIPVVLRLNGKLDIDALTNSLKQVVNRHEALRTIILENDGVAYQQVMQEDMLPVSFINGLQFEMQGELKNTILSLVNEPFDLGKDHMLRVALISLNDLEHVLVVTMHHIASDGWSIAIIVKEVVEFYDAYISNRPAVLPPLSIQYADYSIWQRKYLDGDVLERKISYWKEKLKGTTPLQLPLDYTRPAVQSTRGANTHFRINKELSNGLQLLSQQQGATLFMTLLAAFKILMHRYSGQDDICVGTPIAGRQQQEIEDLIGFFVNTLALRTQVDSSASFTTLLQKVKDTTLEAYANQEIPFEKVVEVLVKERDMGRSPLLQVMFILQNTPDIPALQLGDIQLARETAGHHTSKFEITFNIVQSAHGLDVTVEYCTDLFKTETIVRMIGHFEELLNAIIKEPAKGVGLLTMLKTAEKEQLLNGFNDTQVVYNRPATIPSLFEEQVVKTPEGIAAVFENKQLTYRELNERSNQLAHFLRSKGIKDEMLVPICLERSIEMIVGIMGILKAGGAYVPIDPEYPNERIGYMLNDLSANIILCSKSSKEKLAFVADLDTIELDGDLTIIGNQPSVNLCLPLQSHHLAYVIYTSGSTGMPKGAMNEHGAVTNRLLWAQDYFNVGSTDSILQKTTFSFDVSVWELLLPLISGARLVFATPEGNRDNEYLKQTIEAQNITIVHFVPSMLDIFLPALQAGDCAKLQNVLCSGEALKPGQVALFKQKLPATALYNLYGPTEAAVDVTYWNVPTNQQQVDMVPIGKPVANTTIYILDKQNNIAPTGCSGEIHIGGVQVGRGYLNRPDLTAERFINDPFSSLPGARLYKTGDNGRWLPDGNIEYLGRIDTQVKIRGYRIELGEIENVLLGCSGVSQCAVLAKEDSNGNNRLVGYIVPEGPFDREAIINYLKEKLPAYMVPSLWVPLDELPLTASGKIDRKALPSPDAQVSTGKYIAARTAAERKLVKIWQEILKVDLVGVEDNFFELGGHSLLAMRVVSMVRKEMEVELAIKHLFAFPSIAVLAQHIESQTRGLMLPPVDVQFRPDLIPLSFSQERLWFIDRFEGSVQYHMPAILELKGKLDTGSLTHTLQNIVNRHEVLRTLILENEGVPHQVIMPKDGLQVSYIDGSGYRKDSEGLHKNIRQLINIPFDLSKDHMLRAAVITLEQDIHILVVTIHHIASDGWSISIIVKEVMELYSAFKQARTDDLAPMDIQYADYAIWQRKYIDGEILEKKLSYWKRQLQGVAPLQLPLDYARPDIQSMKGASGAFRIDKELSSELVSLSKQQGTTLFMTLLAAFNVLLHRYSGQEDICIGTPIAGRQQKELEDLVGFFVNTLALRSAVDGDSSFIDLLQQVRATTLEAYDHQEVPFEKVVEAVVKTRETSRSPLFQVMFILQNTEQAEDFQLDELELKRLSSKNTTTKFELTFSLTEFSDGINGTVEYSSDLYSEQTIQKMVIHFKALLRAIVTTPGQKIAMLPMLTQSEEQQLLFTFNETAKAYPRDKSIVDLFEEQVAKTPNRVSVVFNGVQLTYGELNEQANEFAHYLISMGVNENDLVPICIERSIEMVIGVIAILKAGAAYVPIDPEYPLERISYMLGDIDAQLIITKKAIRSSILHHDNINIVEIDGDWKASGTQVENPSRKYHPDQLAYLIYTSGSTGRPKGVKMPGGAVVNLLNWQEKQFFNKKRRVLQFASLNFDVSFQEIFSTLCFGSTLYLIDAERRKDAVELLKDIVNFEITHLFVPYIVLKNLAESIALMSSYDALWLEEVIVAGEQLKLTEDILFLLKRNIGSIINQYGPTEAHVVSSYKIDMYGDLPVLPPIGKPIDNTRLYILGSNQQLVPTRVSGELYIGGVQVAHGYLNQPEQTVEKFIPDFFSNDPTARLYKTGDMARWLPDGNIEYLGRIDDQVKIRGFRVELGEIESTLQQSGLVKSAAVLAKADNTGTNKLIAYVVPDGTFDKDALQAFLKTKLPDFMVPASWVVLESLPVTHNGKLDKKALPEPDAIELSGNQYVAPRNELEEKLASIWQEILQVERVGIFDNFFELGGHSLLIMRLVSAIRKKLDLNLLINDIFIYPTIADFTNNMVEKFKNPSLPVVNNKYLVPIKSSGNKLPLYIVAGGGGTARRFIKFAEMMDADQPVYVLQPPIDLNELKEFPDTIEKIAGKFIEEIMTRNPEGPYALSGHCLGGVIAFEMARQLKLVGKKVHMLAMFDTVMRKRERRELANFRNMYNMPLHLKRFISKAVIKFDFETYLLKKHPKKALQYKVKSFKHLFKRIKRKKSTADELEYVGLEIFNESSDAYVAAGRKFKIIPYDGELILFYAKERYYFTDVSNNIRYKKVSLNDDVKNIWRNYASSVSIYEVEGDHSDMFEPVWGDKFALILQQQLDKPINE
ncbi:MAG: amino acid adenylation domain-containing protein [Ferruginibacter sp.]